MDFFLGFTKLNPTAVAWLCSIKMLFLEISQNSQESICARVSFLINLQPLGLLIVLLNSVTCSVFVLIRIDTIFQRISKIISKFAFQGVTHRQKQTFSKFYLAADTLWLAKTARRVLGYITDVVIFVVF